jgi:hypothetical protein
VHDSATIGDSFTPAYPPKVVVISENKDTAVHFPPLAGGISVEGVGRGGKTVASFPWIKDAPVVIYWGDMDRDGFEILNGYREDLGRDVASILMDPVTYERYEPFGTNDDQYGKPIAAGPLRPAPHLRAPELEVYRQVLDPDQTGHRRIEQERIPLSSALSAVRCELGSVRGVR